MPLSRGFRVQDLPSVNVNDKAALVFISPGVNEDLLKAGVDWKERLFKIMYTVCDTSTMLDPKGHRHRAAPNPYFVHASRIYGEMSKGPRNACCSRVCVCASFYSFSTHAVMGVLFYPIFRLQCVA
ncbi:unnamed protein product [Pylaiella littoralis]